MDSKSMRVIKHILSVLLHWMKRRKSRCNQNRHSCALQKVLIPNWLSKSEIMSNIDNIIALFWRWRYARMATDYLNRAPYIFFSIWVCNAICTNYKSNETKLQTGMSQNKSIVCSIHKPWHSSQSHMQPWLLMFGIYVPKELNSENNKWRQNKEARWMESS